MGQPIRQMRSSICDSPEIASKMETLAGMLEDVKGKKAYGYLKKPVKVQVDAVVDGLAKRPKVAECYEIWNQLRDDVEQYYKDTPRERLHLSRQKEFKVIKNMVTREAEHIRLNAFPFEDGHMTDENDEELNTVFSSPPSMWEMVMAYRDAKEVLEDEDMTEEEKRNQIHTLEQLWDSGCTVAAHPLGK